MRPLFALLSAAALVVGASFPTARSSTSATPLAQARVHVSGEYTRPHMLRVRRAPPTGAGDPAAQVAAVEPSYVALEANAQSPQDGTAAESAQDKEGESAHRSPAPASTAAARALALSRDAAAKSTARPPSQSARTTIPATSSSIAAPAPAPATSTGPAAPGLLAAPLPGRTLAVRPIGLIVLSSILGLLLAVLAYMTYERLQYRRQFHARRSAFATRREAAGAGAGAGGQSGLELRAGGGMGMGWSG